MIDILTFQEVTVKCFLTSLISHLFLYSMIFSKQIALLAVGIPDSAYALKSGMEAIENGSLANFRLILIMMVSISLKKVTNI